jgi:hypothetical protein
MAGWKGNLTIARQGACDDYSKGMFVCASQLAFSVEKLKSQKQK